MDFLDPNKKRSNKIKLYVGYILVAIAISMSALVLLFANSGYRLDTEGNVTQNGLLFVNSHPDGATAYIEGIYNKYKTQGKTDTKFDLREGRYRVTINMDRYRSWQKELSVDGGSVERLAYPFLFPEKLETKKLKEYPAETHIVSSSPDRKWIIVQYPNDISKFDVFDTSNLEKPNSGFVIPKNILTTGESQNLEMIEWSTDNSNVLMKHTYDNQVEFIIVNKDNPESSINVNTLTGQKPYAVTLKDRKIDQLLLHMSPDGLLQQFDIKTKIFVPLVSKALAFKSHGDDMLVYVAPIENNQKQVEAHMKTKDKDYVLRKLSADSNYLVDVAKFSDAWYVVVGASKDNSVYVYKDPLVILSSDKPKAIIFGRTLRINNPQHVSFSANTRIIAVQSGQNFAVYDAETDRQTKYEVHDKFDTDRPAEWMDGHRLISSTNKTALVFDFDGLNQQKLMSVDSNTDLMFDRDYKTAFSFASADNNGKFNLNQTSLQVKN